jgi:hypothetical protein
MLRSLFLTTLQLEWLVDSCNCNCHRDVCAWTKRDVLIVESNLHRGQRGLHLLAAPNAGFFVSRLSGLSGLHLTVHCLESDRFMTDLATAGRCLIGA